MVDQLVSLRDKDHAPFEMDIHIPEDVQERIAEEGIQDGKTGHSDVCPQHHEGDLRPMLVVEPESERDLRQLQVHGPVAMPSYHGIESEHRKGQRAQDQRFQRDAREDALAGDPKVDGENQMGAEAHIH